MNHNVVNDRKACVVPRDFYTFDPWEGRCISVRTLGDVCTFRGYGFYRPWENIIGRKFSAYSFAVV